MPLRLVRPTEELEEKAIAFRQEFFDNNERTINGSEMFDKTDSYDEWLKSVTDNTSAETVNPDWVVTDTFFAVDESDRIIGIIDLRHTLKGFLVDFGNSGYSVRPSERRKGYATEMLKLLSEYSAGIGMKELYLAAEKNNNPSVRTIIKNGGVYVRSFELESEQVDVYRIAL